MRSLRVLRAVAAVTAKLPGTQRLIESDLVRRAKLKAGKEVTSTRAVDIARLLDDAGIAYWLAGGWGVDALVGRQTRKHADLDVVVDATLDKVTAALESCGLTHVATETSIPPMPTVWVLSDRAGTTVEVMPIDRTTSPFADPDAFANGNIDGHSVACLSAATQRALRRGYRNRPVDRADLATLDARDDE